MNEEEKSNIDEAIEKINAFNASNEDDSIETLSDNSTDTEQPVAADVPSNDEIDPEKTIVAEGPIVNVEPEQPVVTEEPITENKEESLEIVSSDNTDEQKEEKKPKKKGNKAIVILIVLILLVIGGGVFYYIKFMAKTEEPKKVNNKPTEYKSEYRLSGNGLENFDLQFLKLENETKNKVYSPLSIKYALEMLSEGASGDTKSQIDAVIGDYKSRTYLNDDHMSFANAVFIRNSFKDAIKNTYTTNLKSKYNAEVIYDNFDNPNNINKWVSDKTFNLINNLLNDVSTNNFFLINALAIDMNWNNQVHCEGLHKIPCVNDGMYSVRYAHEKLDDTSTSAYGLSEYPYFDEGAFYGRYNYKTNQYEPNKFNGKEGIKGAEILADFNKYDIVKELGEDKIKEMLRPEYEAWLNTEDGKNDLPVEEGLNSFIKELKENYGKAANSTDFLVHEDENVRVFAKDLQNYNNTTLQYVGIMPKNEKLYKYVEKVSSKDINDIISNLKEVNINNFDEGYVTRIRGFIPFFKFEYELELLEDLNKMGIKDAFDIEKANFSNLTSSKGTYIDKAIHKANIEFSNDGIKASASTAVGGAGAVSGPFFEHLFKVPVKDIDVTFDKPYMYLIRDKATGEVWFTGTVYEPIQKSN